MTRGEQDESGRAYEGQTKRNHVPGTAYCIVVGQM